MAVATILIIVFAGAIGASIGVLGYFLASFTLYALFGVIVAFLAVARAKHVTGRSWLALVAVVPLVNLFLIFMPKSEDAPPEYAVPEFMKGHSGLLIAIALFACNTAIEVVSRLYEANVE